MKVRKKTKDERMEDYQDEVEMGKEMKKGTSMKVCVDV